MLGSPSLYSVDPSYGEDDPLLEQKRADIVHTAAVMLEKSGLIRYDRKSGVFRASLSSLSLHTSFPCVLSPSSSIAHRRRRRERS